jgi:hypothetical protein
MRIDSSGRVGIGTDSPAEPLHVQEGSSGITARAGTVALIEGSGNTKVTVASGATSTGELLFGRSTDNDVGRIVYDHNDNSLAFATNGSERMRIDSSGNLLVGTTDTDPSNNGAGGDAGHAFSSTGYISSARSGDTVALFNRMDSDGDIASFRKDGLPVGSIGTVSGDIRIGGLDDNHASIRFAASSKAVLPVKNSDGGLSDNTTDLGASNARFKDLYLSGAVKSQSVELEDIKAKDTNGLNLQTSNGQKRVVLNNSGNLLVGTDDAAVSSSTGSVTGAVINNSGLFEAAKTGTVMELNRLSYGKILNFRKEGTTVGSINTFNATEFGLVSQKNLVLTQNTTTERNLVFSSSYFSPFASDDNTIDLGRSVARFDDIYATNGTIQTSDRNEKQDIAELSEAEQRVAVAAKGLLRKFRWKDSVAEKGDDARIHFGIIAQDLQAAFEAEGLDAGDYAMFISTTWTDEETSEEKTRMGVRYSELLAFIISAI